MHFYWASAVAVSIAAMACGASPIAAKTPDAEAKQAKPKKSKKAPLAPGTLTNADIFAYITTGMPDDQIIAKIMAEPGFYTFKPKEIDTLSYMQGDFRRASDFNNRMFAAMYAKMNNTNEMAAQERALPIKMPFVDPLVGHFLSDVAWYSGDSREGQEIELRDKQTVFIWSDNPAARALLIKVVRKNARFKPVFDARYADFILHFEGSTGSSLTQTSGGGSMTECSGSYCRTISSGPSFSSNSFQNARLQALYYLPSTKGDDRCLNYRGQYCTNQSKKSVRNYEAYVFFNVSKSRGNGLLNETAFNAVMYDFFNAVRRADAAPANQTPKYPNGALAKVK